MTPIDHASQDYMRQCAKDAKLTEQVRILTRAEAKRAFLRMPYLWPGDYPDTWQDELRKAMQTAARRECHIPKLPCMNSPNNQMALSESAKAEARMFDILGKYGPCPIDKITQHTGIGRPAINRALAAMEANGHVIKSKRPIKGKFNGSFCYVYALETK